MRTPSTRYPEALPNPIALERLCRSLAMIEALLSPAQEDRYYRFNQHWNPEKGHRMATMYNGLGDEWFLLFLANGSSILKGFAHEYALPDGPPKGIYAGLPRELLECLTNDLAMSMPDVTFCLWNVGAGWQQGAAHSSDGNDSDGSAGMLAVLSAEPEVYQEFARSYYQRELSLAAIRRIYAQEPLTPELIATITNEVSLDSLKEDLYEIGYPVARP